VCLALLKERLELSAQPPVESLLTQGEHGKRTPLKLARNFGFHLDQSLHGSSPDAVEMYKNNEST
jgi:hypothetical protein